MALREAVKTGCYTLPDSLLLPGVSECRKSVAVTGKIRVMLYAHVHLRSVKDISLPTSPREEEDEEEFFQ